LPLALSRRAEWNRACSQELAVFPEGPANGAHPAPRRQVLRAGGVIFEFYDAKDERPPWRCDRKGPNRGEYDFRVKFDSIRDYHWSAAVTACLLLEKE
jgi:hypothetical protein